MIPWHAQIFTLYPEMFPGYLAHSLAGQALKKELWSYDTVNIRDYGIGKHAQVDDTPCGGGAGMVLRPDVLGDALDSHLKPGSRLLYMSPRGKLLTQPLVKELAKTPNISIICGRFEGMDQRIIDHYNVEEISIGDYILSGGEVAALTLMDSCIRLLPGVLGNKETLSEESFTENDDFSGLLEYPLYTRPPEWRSLSVPQVLLSGHHARIAQWKKEQSCLITRERRPDIWECYTKIRSSKED